MERPRLRLEFDRRGFILGLGTVLVLGTAMHLASENVTLTTSYPSPSGIYQRVTTTNQTILARDAGSVGVRTATPGATLDVNGTVLARGNLTTNGSRTGLQGLDGPNGWHWIMSGGTTEGVHNAFGFNPATRVVGPGPGWSLAGGGGRAWSGYFTGNGPTGNLFVPLGFRPIAATCGANVVGRFGAWCHPRCWYSFGPNYVIFHQQMMDGPSCLGTWSVNGWWSYSVMVMGQ